MDPGYYLITNACVQLIAGLSRMGIYYMPGNGPWLTAGQEYNPVKR
jgi:hypothetical protein